MKHYDGQAWQSYLDGLLSPQESDEMELHLYRCDECLERYMLCMDLKSDALPVMETDDKLFTDAILARTMGTKRSWYRSTIVHYGIAAAATLILVATGFFHGLSQELGPQGAFGQPPSSASSAQTPSPHDQPFSDQLLNKTLSWLDTLQK
ncbi:zf-HC2 domain-containing protein [Bacillus sp. 3255]|uniref:anti-sigma factor family protein n=1 Tax=Bacillus sp. 3255 TaxID=2817904 RepID=UPI002863BF59|nr:zf-HC2 domain-containing protein [Bacillus sp. 3255]MDR6883590.1 anti-sigma factor RsiW [Bacillus sp. 3255]